MDVFKILGVADVDQLISGLVRLALAAFCGALIGFERERRRRPAGLRTHMLVCLGAALVMITGEQINGALSSGGDVTRMGAQVVSGIGFLGAGTIIVDRQNRIRGLTTAAGLWTSACIGLAIGAGYYLGGLFACALTLIIVTALLGIEKTFFSRESIFSLYIEFENMDMLYPSLSQMSALGYKIMELEVSGHENDIFAPPSANMIVKLPLKVDRDAISEPIMGIDGISYVKIK